MEVGVKLDKDFERFFNVLKEEFGEDFSNINGLSDDKLSYSDFLDNFVAKKTVADASVDGSSNVHSKDIVTMRSEMSKPHEKLFALSKIFRELKQKYGLKIAKKWLKLEWSRALYMHDCNSATLISYCFAYDLTRLAEEGLFYLPDHNKIEPAKHLETFVDFVKEFVNFNSNRTSGACGLPNLIPFMYYFWNKDVKDGHYPRNQTPETFAKSEIQRMIYGFNQPYTRDGIQSAFINTSIFDSEYFDALFGGSVFPDGELMIDHKDGIMLFQKWFMEEMSAIKDRGRMFTFPVNSISLIKRNGKFADEEFARWACNQNRKWNDSNIFVDDSVTSLSNCCFDGSQLTLTKSSDGVNYMTFKDLYNSPYNSTKRNFTVFHNGSWVKGKPIRLPKRPMYKITTANNKELIVTDNHLHPVLKNGKNPSVLQTAQLTTNDYLMFNTKELNSFPEVNKYLTYNQGYLIGMYLGDGSIEDNRVNLSLNEYKWETSNDILNKATNELNVPAFKLWKPYNNVYPVWVGSADLVGFIRQFVSGNYSFEKHLNEDCLLQSVEFRTGILDGFYATDGGNSNRIYTTSAQLTKDTEALITSLGKQSIIDVSDRTDEPAVIRGKSYKRNYPLYCVRWYESSNKRKRNDVYIWQNNSVYFKIVSIEPVESTDDYCYCFEMENKDDPYFTLPNGVITHNCRLKSNIRDIGYFNSIGGSALKVGSIKVSTINLARIAYESNGNEKKYISILKDRLLIDMQALDVVREIIKKNVNKGLLPNFQNGLMDFQHLYNTVGLNGVFETMQFFGYVSYDEFGNAFYTDDAMKFGKTIFEVIHEATKDFAKDKDYIVNVEQVPGETCAARFMQADKLLYRDKVVDMLPLYGNQWIPLGIKTTLKERIRICSIFDGYCNGGSICHINIDKPIADEETAWKLLNYITDQGVTYFAFNGKLSSCPDGHLFYGNICPTCGQHKNAEYTRTVGFYTKTDSWSTERKEEYKMREWQPLSDKGIDA